MGPRSDNLVEADARIRHVPLAPEAVLLNAPWTSSVPVVPEGRSAGGMCIRQEKLSDMVGE